MEDISPTIDIIPEISVEMTHIQIPLDNSLKKAQIKLLQGYRDKSYVNALLCNKSNETYSFIKSLVNIPLILSSTILAILNSSTFDPQNMKLPNVIINSITGLTLAMINNFKLSEKETNFKVVGIKMNKLCHHIEDILANERDSLDTEQIRSFIKEYDSLLEQIDYSFPNHIQKKIATEMRKKKRVLPNSLNCVGDYDNMDNIKHLEGMMSNKV
tara:strand:- start:17 stop:658 length:642 start_codon:yes stop_codon:yes gene_type:complete